MQQLRPLNDVARKSARLHDEYRGVVPPLADPDAPDRPFWSVMIPTFNCAGLLRQTLQSVLQQAPGPDRMQIQVVDDASTLDDPETVVREIGGGRVEFYRQPKNLGHSRNFNSALARSRGHVVHLLHGDDWVADGFYAKMEALYAAHPDIGAALCRHTITDHAGADLWVSPVEREDPGVIVDWVQRIAAKQLLQAPSITVRREAYEALGGFDTRIKTCGEDWEMWVRVAANYPVGYDPTPMAFYRDNANSLTKTSIRSGQNIRDVRLAQKIAKTYLTGGPADAAIRQSGVAWAEWAVYWAWRMFDGGQYRAGMVQLRQALMCSHSRQTLKDVARIGSFAARRAISSYRMPKGV